MTDGLLLLVAIAAVLLAGLSFVFSATQTALFRIESLPSAFVGDGNGGRDDTTRIAALVLTGGVVANASLIVLLLWLGWNVPAVAGWQFWKVTVGVIGLVGVVCELVPKLIGYARPEGTLRLTEPLVRLFGALFGGVAGFLNQMANRLAGWLTPRGIVPYRPLDEDELDTLVRVGEHEGALSVAESEIIQEIIKLDEKTAKDCMVPRVDMQAVPDALSRDQLMEEIRTGRHRFLPVYHETPDNIVGVLDVIAFLHRDGCGDAGGDYLEAMGEPWFVAETMGAIELQREFLSSCKGLAVVIDEYGGTEGVVTLADIIDDLINDAVPSGDNSLYIEHMDDGSLMVGGRARLDDISDELGVEIEADGIDTIGGLVFNHLGYLPKAADAVDIPPLSIVVRRAKRKRITEMVLWLRNEDNGAEVAPEENDIESGGDRIL